MLMQKSQVLLVAFLLFLSSCTSLSNQIAVHTGTQESTSSVPKYGILS